MAEVNMGSRLAAVVKGLAVDMVQQANSGHPGAPMGMADLAVVLWSHALRYDPADPSWPDRDRVVLSNGHASALLYTMLHLSGTSLSLDDLRAFRQWGSRTAGHPEYGEAPGIETTTGPLGQGIANAVGMALAEAALRARFGEALVGHRVWCFAGDGCLMEGISQEAASLAGHLGLGRLTVLWDDNRITIDGTTDLAFTEDVPARFRALGWAVLEIDGHDHAAIATALDAARAQEARPTLIRCRTTIARGAPTLAGSNKSHGSPLGAAEIAGFKAAAGLPAESFYVDGAALSWLRAGDAARRAAREDWEGRVAAHPDGAAFRARLAGARLDGVAWPTFAAGTKLATRKASHRALEALAAGVDGLIGGSADLAESNGTHLGKHGDIGPGRFSGKTIHFGIREHAMGAICNGLSLHGGFRPFCATFLVFSDYMRPAVRLAALMHQPVVYVFTHDSVFLGEDGPTHQPIEHLMALRAIPNLVVLRPGDAAETVEAWKVAMERSDGPTALCLSRQDLAVLDRGVLGAADGVRRGGYVLADAPSGLALDVVLVATGSELGLALGARDALAAEGRGARVVSMPSFELFRRLPAADRAAVLPAGVPRVSVEAGTTFGWQAIVGLDGASVGIDRFGASAPAAVLAERLGLTVGAVVAAARGVLAAGA
jgi:transketolase